MTRAPTPDQRRAITESGGDLCVVAGAGSGKTYVLTERVVHRVTQDGVPLAQVLAITFTEKAAAEMKHRLAAALEAAAFEGTVRAGARAEIEAAAISTIHAFCARLLREFAVEAGVDPAFAVLDGTEGDRRLRAALDAFTAELASADPAAFELLATLAGDDPAETLLDVYRLAQASGAAPGEFVRRTQDVPAVRDVLTAVRTCLRELADVAPSATGATAERTTLVLAAGRALLPDDAPAAAHEEALARVADEIRGVFSKAVKEEMGALKDAVRAALSAVAEHALAPLRERLARSVERLDALYEDAKGHGEELDFADLERRAVALLETRADVRAAVRRRWPEVLVDEFQDVNPLQARLLDAVSTPGRLFVVGDPKQSIYGFRGADVGVFRDRLAHTRATQPQGVVELRASFRSRPEVLTAVASVFSGGVGGGGDARLDAGRAWRPAAQPAVEVFAFPADTMGEGRTGEAAWIARRIAALVEDGHPLAAPTDVDADATRPCEFGDIAVLLRATTHLKTLEAALVARDVPYVVVKGRGFFLAREVVDLAHLLACVDDARDDLALAAVLRSPACGLSEDGLFTVCAARAPGEAIADVLPRGAEALPELATADAHALAVFTAVLADLRRRRAWEGVAPLVERALARTRLDVLALGRPNGRQRAANLRKVRDLARVADRAGVSLAEFVVDLRDLREREVREAEAATATHGAVTLMTVHASKGLEFPVVFVPDLGKSQRDRGGDVVAHGRMGVGLKRRGRRGGPEPWTHVRVKAARALADADESERLLYVAMTRAAEHLVLSATIPTKNEMRPWWDRVTAAFGFTLPVAEDRELEITAGGGGARVRLHAVAPAADATGAPARTLLGRVARELAQGRVPARPLRDDAVADAARLLAEAARRPPPPDGTPYQTTVSALVAFARCPQEYRLRHVLGVPETLDLRLSGAATAFDLAEREAPREEASGDDEDDIAIGARAVGRAAHAALELLVPAFDADVARTVEEALRAETGGAPPDPGDIARLVRWAEGFRDGELGRAVAQAPRARVRREQAFLLRAGRTIVRGQIDLLWRGAAGGTVVVDYKASAAPEPRPEHRLQMTLYALAMRGVDGALPERLALWSLPAARALDVPCGEDEARALEDGLLAEFADRAARSDFVPRDEPPCRPCAYRTRCFFSRAR